jgi:hypothetical protein
LHEIGGFEAHSTKRSLSLQNEVAEGKSKKSVPVTEPKPEKAAEKLGKLVGKPSETRNAREGKRASVSRRDSLQKKERTTTGEVLPAAKKESSKTANDASKVSKENKLSTTSRRSSTIQNKSVPARKSSLKDSNRGVVNANQKLQSVVIKEEREEEPIASTTTTVDG